MTSRIRRRHAQLAAEEQGDDVAAPPAEITPDDSASLATVPQHVPETVIPAVIETASPPSRPMPAYRQQISHRRRQHDEQLCLF